jgi:AAA15 family ATPase/GTPase
MLLRVAFSNFRSVREEQELSLVATSLAGPEGAVLPLNGIREKALRVAAIYGANASGKTNVLRALQFISEAVEESQSSWKPDHRIPRQPFRLAGDPSATTSTFEVDVLLDGTRYQYGFSLDDLSIIDEWLFAFPSPRRQLWFRRSRSEFTFGKSLIGKNRTIERVTRANSLFLSAAAQNNHKQLTPLYRWFASSLSFVPSERELNRIVAIEACGDPDSKMRMENFLRGADLGLASIEVTERDVPASTLKVLRVLRETMPSTELPAEFPSKLPDVEFFHRCEHDSMVRLPIASESDGTLALFDLLAPVMKTLDSGGVLAVDELDRSLHPLLALELVRMFNDGERNPRGAQLIFNTHDTNLLDFEVLRRDQVWFTEKDKCGATHLYPLTDFKPRKQENLQRGYLQGRYGAVPFLNPARLFGALSADRNPSAD